MKLKLVSPCMIAGVKYDAGVHEVSDDFASNWFILALMQNGKASIVEKPKPAPVVPEAPEEVPPVPVTTPEVKPAVPAKPAAKPAVPKKDEAKKAEKAKEEPKAKE